MRPQLIIDLSDRAFCGLYVTPEGDILPCSQEVNQVVSRYISAEIVFDPQVSEHPDFIWEDAAEALEKTNSQSFFQRVRRLGLYRPWDLQAPIGALHLPSPLTVLSSPAALLDPVARGRLPAVAIVLLQALLEPVFSFVTSRGSATTDIEAVVVIPAQCGRQARLAIHKVFRRRGFRKLRLLHREVAAAMSLLETPSTECLVLDVTDDDLHLSRVAVERDKEERRFRTLAARTIHGLGWSYWVRQLAAALTAQGQIPDTSDSAVFAMDRALTTLLNGTPNSPHQTPLSLRLTRSMIEGAVDGERFDQWSAEVRSRLEPYLATLSFIGSPAILLGTICGLEPLRKLFLSLIAAEQPAALADVPVLERTTRSVAGVLQWLRADPARRVTTPPCGGLRLNTLRGDTVEILAAAHLPAAGESCYLREHFQLSGDRQIADSFPLQLLWGADNAPEGNETLCGLPLEFGPRSHEKGSVWLDLHLRRSISGHRLSGTVAGGLEHETFTARAFFAKSLHPFPSLTRDEENLL